MQTSRHLAIIALLAAFLLQASTAISQTNTGSISGYNRSIKAGHDSDGDGVPDNKDAYPYDASKAFNNVYPSKGMSTLLFEDLWPFKGDYDFNDLVIDYRFNTITDALNYVTGIEYKFVPRASGAVAKNGFAFQLDGVSADKILSVSGSKMDRGWSALNDNGTEAGQSADANIIVFNYANNVFHGQVNAGSTINTFSNLKTMTADTITVLITFKPQAVSFTTLTAFRFNPYLIADQTRGREVHLPNRMPSAKMDRAWFGKGDDNSNPAAGRYFKSKSGLPWALEITTTIPHAQEKVDFSKAYPHFFDWGESKGKNNAEWYLDKTGNRDVSKLYVDR